MLRVAGTLATAVVVGSLFWSTAAPAGRADRYTPVILSVPSSPRWFKGADNRFHLVYEMKLLNAFEIPVNVTSVNVRDARRGRTLTTLSGGALTEAMSLLGSTTLPTTTLPPATTGVVWFELTFERRSRIPAVVNHRVVVRVPPGLPVPETIALTAGRARVDRRPPVVLGPPLRGAGWAAIGSCCDGPHRRALQPVDGGLHLAQRFAIDFNRLDARNRITTGDPSLNVSYPTYDQPVIAVASARVVVAQDRFSDQVPNDPRPVTLDEADGNHVILNLGRGRFAFYAHLKPGSVVVRAGQRVRKGQLLARTGNSGSSSGPHLHFHVMNRPSALAADGMPYVFDRFRFIGRTPPVEDLIAGGYDRTQQPIPIDAAGAGPRRAELPLGRDLVTFR